MGSPRPTEQMALGEESSCKALGLTSEFSRASASVCCAGWALSPLIRWPAWSAALSSKEPSSQVSFSAQTGSPGRGLGAAVHSIAAELRRGCGAVAGTSTREGPLLRTDAKSGDFVT